MSRRRVLASGLLVVAVAAACSLTTDLDGFTGGAFDDGGPADSPADVPTETSPVVDAAGDSPDASDASSCACTNLVSAYRFADPNVLGLDFFGKNTMTSVKGSPKQSSVTPPGLAGHSIQLDGSSNVCIDSGFTFDSTKDHTLCWWARPDALANNTNQFAQTCGYDTWTNNSGVDYEWRINNCNDGGAVNFEVPGVYAVGKWVQICQTYTRASLTRRVVIDGDTSRASSTTDPVPIVEEPGASWCIGAYSGGGFWTGLLYLPLWFDRVLTDAEIARVSASACCLP